MGNKFQPYNSSEVDGVFPILLQKGVDDVFPTRITLAVDQIPTKWRRAKVTFIPKTGKEDGTDPRGSVFRFSVLM